MSIKPKIPAIVLSLNVTGLAVVRALARYGVEVHGVYRWEGELGRSSRYCNKLIDLRGKIKNDGELVNWLVDYAESLDERPVVFPTSDPTAMWLADNHERLSRVCRIWDYDHDKLSNVMCKSTLYQAATAAGVLVPPGLNAPDIDEVKQWCEQNKAPYLVKPFYNFTEDFKNLTFDDKQPLLDFLQERKTGASDLVIQRVLRGGDGWIFDCYGLCEKNGNVVTMASHRRIRQSPPDFGITCYGEIPGIPRDVGEQALFDRTEKLLAELGHHGIFGIEWLQDRETGELYLLDFNARPFYSIGHLQDCGLNLPALAYQELCGEDLSNVELIPEVTGKRWIDFWSDASTFNRLRKSGRMTWGEWLASLLQSRANAVWCASDPLPAVLQTLRKGKELIKYLFTRH